MQWLLLTGAIGVEVCATLALRASDGFTRVTWAAVTVAGYLLAFVLLSQVLRLGMPVGVAYAIWSGVGVALTAVAGKFLWDDPLTPFMGLGILLIIGGVALVQSGTPSHGGG
ncbi:MAG: DMT family transporter [Micromonosporaceae bacterium]